MTCLNVAHHDDKTGSSGRRMNRWVQQVMRVGYHRFCPAESWTPAINVYEDDEQYYVVVDLAGVTGDQVDIQVNPRGELMLAGRRDLPEPCDGPKGNLRLHLMEIDHGEFCRTIELPEDADLDRIEACTRRSGMLWVSIAKKR